MKKSILFWSVIVGVLFLAARGLLSLFGLEFRVWIREPVTLLTVSQYAYLNGVHKHTVLNWVKAGKVPYLPIKHGIYTRYAIPSNAIPPMVRPDRGGPLSDQSA